LTAWHSAAFTNSDSYPTPSSTFSQANTKIISRRHILDAEFARRIGGGGESLGGNLRLFRRRPSQLQLLHDRRHFLRHLTILQRQVDPAQLPLVTEFRTMLSTVAGFG